MTMAATAGYGRRKDPGVSAAPGPHRGGQAGSSWGGGGEGRGPTSSSWRSTINRTVLSSSSVTLEAWSLPKYSPPQPLESHLERWSGTLSRTTLSG